MQLAAYYSGKAIDITKTTTTRFIYPFTSHFGIITATLAFTFSEFKI